MIRICIYINTVFNEVFIVIVLLFKLGIHVLNNNNSKKKMFFSLYIDLKDL